MMKKKLAMLLPLLLITALMLAACGKPGVNSPTDDGKGGDNPPDHEQQDPGTATDGLAYTLINADQEYAVSKGTANTDGAVYIPSRHNDKPVTSIGDRAFYNCIGLTSITIPAGVTSIGERAFHSCIGITSITIPAGVTSIGTSAFSGCRGLTSITVASGNSAYKSEGNCLLSKDGKTLILGCKTSVIPDSVTSIGEGAFWYCIGLTSITIPASVTSIGIEAFYNCSGITSITIPDSVTSIGSGAFSGTAWYNAQANGLVYAGKVAYRYKGTMPANTSITLLAGTKGIADNAFYGCSNLTSITIPDSVTSIGNSAFYGCTSLTSIKMRRASSSGMTLGSYWNDTNGATSGGVIPVTWGYTGE